MKDPGKSPCKNEGQNFYSTPVSGQFPSVRFFIFDITAASTTAITDNAHVSKRFRHRVRRSARNWRRPTAWSLQPGCSGKGHFQEQVRITSQAVPQVSLCAHSILLVAPRVQKGSLWGSMERLDTMQPFTSMHPNLVHPACLPFHACGQPCHSMPSRALPCLAAPSSWPFYASWLPSS